MGGRIFQYLDGVIQTVAGAWGPEDDPPFQYLDGVIQTPPLLHPLLHRKS